MSEKYRVTNAADFGPLPTVEEVNRGRTDLALREWQSWAFDLVTEHSLPGEPISDDSVLRDRITAALTERATVTPLRELERREIEKALKVTNGSVLKAAKLLGMGRATLYRRLGELKATDPVVRAVPVGDPKERRLDVTFKMRLPADRFTTERESSVEQRSTPFDHESTGGELGG